MKLHSHSGMNDCQAQGSSRSLALYCLGSHETQREASVMFDGQFNLLSGTTNCDQTTSMMRDRSRRATHGRMITILDA
jgi:hypothetical protein